MPITEKYCLNRSAQKMSVGTRRVRSFQETRKKVKEKQININKKENKHILRGELLSLHFFRFIYSKVFAHINL